MSAATATRMVRHMAEMETRGFGDDANALRRIETKFGLPYWSLRYLKLGRAATVDSDLLQRIRGAYLTYCDHQIQKLQHVVAIEKAAVNDADLENLEAKARDLASEIATAKARLKAGRGGRS